MELIDVRYTGGADQSDHGKWCFDCHFPKDIASTRAKEDHDPIVIQTSLDKEE